MNINALQSTDHYCNLFFIKFKTPTANSTSKFLLNEKPDINTYTTTIGTIGNVWNTLRAKSLCIPKNFIYVEISFSCCNEDLSNINFIHSRPVFKPGLIKLDSFQIDFSLKNQCWKEKCKKIYSIKGNLLVLIPVHLNMNEFIHIYLSKVLTFI